MGTHGARKFVAAGFILVLVAAIGVMNCRAAAVAAVLEIQLAATADPACPPNEAEGLPISKRACVAEKVRSTRSGLNQLCLVDGKALLPNPWYTKQECRTGRTGNIEAEAIAQARAIARLDLQGVHGDAFTPGSISANLQWEVRYPNRRVDILMYDRQTPNAPIELIEVRQDPPRGTGEAAAVRRLTDYVNNFPTGANNRPVIRHAFNPVYKDAFRILLTDCAPGVPNRIIYQYTVRSTANDGILMVGRPLERVTPCDGENEPGDVPAQEPVPEDVPEDVDDVPPVVVPAPGRDSDNDGKDDLWPNFRR